MAMAFLQDKNKVKGSLAENEDSMILKLIYLFVKSENNDELVFMRGMREGGDKR
jgi:hypothetical protein